MSADLSPAALKATAGHFAILGDFLGAQPYGNGHINDTYAAVFDQGGTEVRYILQHLNSSIFREPLRHPGGSAGNVIWVARRDPGSQHCNRKC